MKTEGSFCEKGVAKAYLVLPDGTSADNEDAWQSGRKDIESVISWHGREVGEVLNDC